MSSVELAPAIIAHSAYFRVIRGTNSLKYKVMKEQINKNDEQLVEQFFSEIRKQEIPDNGFSARVMEQIDAAAMERTSPSIRRAIWRRLPTILCAVACIALFIFADGFTVLRNALHNTLISVIGNAQPVWEALTGIAHAPLTALPSPLSSLLYIYIAILTIIVVAAYNIILIEKRRNFTF